MLKRIVKVNLPSEYQRVEYLESTGTQYIDTNYRPIQSNFSFNLRISYSTISEHQGFGCRSQADLGSPDNCSFVLYINNGLRSDWNLNKLSVTYYPIVANSIYEFRGTPRQFLVNDTVWLNNITTRNNSSRNADSLTLFAINTRGNVQFMNRCKIYECKLYEDTTIVRNMIPCYRKSDNVAGMYDMISNTFFTNSGTGEFIVGEDVDEPIEVMKEIKAIKRCMPLLPTEYQQVDYLENDGKAYIDTGLKHNKDYEYNLSFLIPNYLANDNIRCLGCTDNLYYFQINTDQSLNYLNIFNGVKVGDSTIIVKNRIKNKTEFVLRDGKVIVDGEVLQETVTRTINANVYLFARCDNNSSITLSLKPVRFFTYCVKNGEEIIQNLIPCYRKSDGRTGMYDTVTGTFFTNAGTGEFAVGGEVNNIVDITKINKVINGEVKTIYI